MSDHETAASEAMFGIFYEDILQETSYFLDALRDTGMIGNIVRLALKHWDHAWLEHLLARLTEAELDLIICGRIPSGYSKGTFDPDSSADTVCNAIYVNSILLQYVVHRGVVNSDSFAKLLAYSIALDVNYCNAWLEACYAHLLDAYIPHSAFRCYLAMCVKCIITGTVDTANLRLDGPICRVLRNHAVTRDILRSWWQALPEREEKLIAYLNHVIGYSRAVLTLQTRWREYMYRSDGNYVRRLIAKYAKYENMDDAYPALPVWQRPKFNFAKLAAVMS
ncbi:hypothetical protein HYH03_011070 [Edaphochlamys debaryana]|uniref:Uncharacterized protein n=1 Tax=Edaphochlamys debaryana TaxID=47281 RepID=A0A836BWS8_9CHLO|nr:hypothetical protein HYH03_011070 [Edaphochlamys debaryana]|eukprot:KAG2490434.1 hypothetical protein HYH03_011070 [Edaphochlamys debaryana]